MKLAISNIAWEPKEAQEVRDMLAECGVSGIEVAPPQLFKCPSEASPDEVKLVRNFWGEYGIGIVAQQSLLFGHPELTLFGSSGTRKLTSDYLREIIKLGGEMQAGIHVFGSPRNRTRGEINMCQALDLAVPFFRVLAESAQLCGTVFCIEPNAPAYGCDFITNTKEAVEIIRLVDHPNFGLNLDAGVLTMNDESYEDALDIALPYLKHFHISEPFLAPMVGGKTDHPRLAKALRERGYLRWVSIEMRRPEIESPLVLIRNCLESAARIYLT